MDQCQQQAVGELTVRCAGDWTPPHARTPEREKHHKQELSIEIPLVFDDLTARETVPDSGMMTGEGCYLEFTSAFR